MFSSPFHRRAHHEVFPASLQADGLTPLAVVGETRLILSRADKHLALDALVVDDLDVDVLAGTPFLIANEISVCPVKCQVRIQDS